MDGCCPHTAIRTRTRADWLRVFGRGVRRALVTFAFASMMVARASKVPAADDIQQINLGPHSFYIPTAWMQVGAVTVYVPPSGVVQKPQSGAIDATGFSIRPGEDWLPYARRELPYLIRVSYVSKDRPAPLSSQIQEWLDESKSLEPDRYGYVRVAAGFSKPSERPQWEEFLYKGFLSKLGEPFLVRSNNVDLSSKA